MDEPDAARCQACAGQSCIKGRDIGRPNFLQLLLAKVTANMGERVTVSLSCPGARVEGDPVPLETIEELGKRDLAWVDVRAALQLRYQAGALDLRLALGALERMPAPLAGTGSIAAVED